MTVNSVKIRRFAALQTGGADWTVLKLPRFAVLNR